MATLFECLVPLCEYDGFESDESTIADDEFEERRMEFVGSLEPDILDLPLQDNPPIDIGSEEREQVKQVLVEWMRGLGEDITDTQAAAMTELMTRAYDVIHGLEVDMQNLKTEQNPDVQEYIDALNTQVKEDLSELNVSNIDDLISNLVGMLKTEKRYSKELKETQDKLFDLAEKLASKEQNVKVEVSVNTTSWKVTLLKYTAIGVLGFGALYFIDKGLRNLGSTALENVEKMAEAYMYNQARRATNRMAARMLGPAMVTWGSKIPMIGPYIVAAGGVIMMATEGAGYLSLPAPPTAAVQVVPSPPPYVPRFMEIAERAHFSSTDKNASPNGHTDRAKLNRIIRKSWDAWKYAQYDYIILEVLSGEQEARHVYVLSGYMDYGENSYVTLVKTPRGDVGLEFPILGIEKTKDEFARFTWEKKSGIVAETRTGSEEWKKAYQSADWKRRLDVVPLVRSGETQVNVLMSSIDRLPLIPQDVGMFIALMRGTELVTYTFSNNALNIEITKVQQSHVPRDGFQRIPGFFGLPVDDIPDDFYIVLRATDFRQVLHTHPLDYEYNMNYEVDASQGVKHYMFTESGERINAWDERITGSHSLEFGEYTVNFLRLDLDLGVVWQTAEEEEEEPVSMTFAPFAFSGAKKRKKRSTSPREMVLGRKPRTVRDIERTVIPDDIGIYQYVRSGEGGRVKEEWVLETEEEHQASMLEYFTFIVDQLTPYKDRIDMETLQSIPLSVSEYTRGTRIELNEVPTPEDEELLESAHVDVVWVVNVQRAIVFNEEVESAKDYSIGTILEVMRDTQPWINSVARRLGLVHLNNPALRYEEIPPELSVVQYIVETGDAEDEWSLVTRDAHLRNIERFNARVVQLYEPRKDTITREDLLRATLTAVVHAHDDYHGDRVSMENMPSNADLDVMHRAGIDAVWVTSDSVLIVEERGTPTIEEYTVGDALQDRGSSAPWILDVQERLMLSYLSIRQAIVNEEPFNYAIIPKEYALVHYADERRERWAIMTQMELDNISIRFNHLVAHLYLNMEDDFEYEDLLLVGFTTTVYRYDEYPQRAAVNTVLSTNQILELRDAGMSVVYIGETDNAIVMVPDTPKPAEYTVGDALEATRMHYPQVEGLADRLGLRIVGLNNREAIISRINRVPGQQRMDPLPRAARAASKLESFTFEPFDSGIKGGGGPRPGS